jgi:hypothetical protein
LTRHEAEGRTRIILAAWYFSSVRRHILFWSNIRADAIATAAFVYAVQNERFGLIFDRTDVDQAMEAI